MSKETIIDLEKAIADIKDLVAVQCTDGNWNWDAYMHGMANGLKCSLAVLTDEDPDYLDAPDVWLKDKEVSMKLHTQTM